MTFSPRSRAEMVHNYSLGEHLHPLRLHRCELETLGTQTAELTKPGRLSLPV